jgi:hypothetical protein
VEGNVREEDEPTISVLKAPPSRTKYLLLTEVELVKLISNGREYDRVS